MTGTKIISKIPGVLMCIAIAILGTAISSVRTNSGFSMPTIAYTFALVHDTQEAFTPELMLALSNIRGVERATVEDMRRGLRSGADPHSWYPQYSIPIYGDPAYHRDIRLRINAITSDMGFTLQSYVLPVVPLWPFRVAEVAVAVLFAWLAMICIRKTDKSLLNVVGQMAAGFGAGVLGLLVLIMVFSFMGTLRGTLSFSLPVVFMVVFLTLVIYSTHRKQKLQQDKRWQ